MYDDLTHKWIRFVILFQIKDISHDMIVVRDVCKENDVDLRERSRFDGGNESGGPEYVKVVLMYTILSRTSSLWGPLR